MAALFRFGTEYRVDVKLEVRLNYRLGRLADLIQTLAHCEALIADLDADRSHYALGMGESSARVKFRVRDIDHRDRVLKAIRDQEFGFDVLEDK